MTDDLQFDDLQPAPGAPVVGSDGRLDLERLTDVKVELTVEVGRTRMSLGEALALGPGSVVTVDRLADKPVDLLCNGRPIARGEVVVIDEEFGLRITEVIGAEPAASTELAAADPGSGGPPALEAA
ncbi:flagellar motor switch protein FliN [Paraconexibacter algicola]|uniref:Flagellar motor switch protein FliN n=1 Tax=Paraconexibacter algicola TaxID=2133960 RepID=A0A2T4UIT8_9ACTN|nr:flagellar motor switch protein FliN [Paraconexibacter algicola]PTL59150.1 flagellar motor switch protein FliN [Paraconexibacter algicola]